MAVFSRLDWFKPMPSVASLSLEKAMSNSLPGPNPPLTIAEHVARIMDVKFGNTPSHAAPIALGFAKAMLDASPSGIAKVAVDDGVNLFILNQSHSNPGFNKSPTPSWRDEANNLFGY